MTTALIVGLVGSIQLCLLWSCFLAGSFRRVNVISAAIIVAMALFLSVPIVLASIDGPSIFSFNPSKVVQQILKASDYWVVAQGILLGFIAPLIGLGVMSLIVSRSNRALGPASVVALAVILIGFTLSVILTSPAAAEPHLGITSVEMDQADLSSELTLPPGFTAKAYLPIGIRKITSIAVGQNDRLFIASQDGVIVTVDEDDLGESLKFFGSKTGAILGIAVSQDGKSVYVSGNGDVFVFTDEDLDGDADHRKRIIKDLPAFVYSNHSNNGIVIGPDDRLYMAQGGTSGSGPENHPLGGTILTFNTDGSDLQVYARGLRNSYDLAFTTSGVLVASDNGPEDGPPHDFDEINVIVAGGDYGYPNYFSLPPEGSGTIAPAYLLPPHVAPTGIVEYASGQFPQKYHGKLFLSLFMINLEGSKVVEITLDETQSEVTATVKDFAGGFITPIDVTVDSKGRLYVADYVGGQVYQISYTGPAN